MTRDDLDALEALAKAATAQPWEWFDDGADASGLFPANSGLRRIGGEPYVDQVLMGDAVGAAGSGWIIVSDEDAAYIVAACNAVPALIKRIRELEGK
jgi:hypothetical protein